MDAEFDNKQPRRGTIGSTLITQPFDGWESEYARYSGERSNG
jgi:hypothetical protein